MPSRKPLTITVAHDYLCPWCSPLVVFEWRGTVVRRINVFGGLQLILASPHEALAQGASAEKITETIGVAIAMGGGPALMYAAPAIEALEQFAGDVQA